MSIKELSKCAFSVLDDFEDGYNYIYVFQLNASTPKSSYVIKSNAEQEIICPYNLDGYYTIYKITLSTMPGEGNYIQGDKLYNSKDELISVYSLLLDADKFEVFSTSNLRKCYINTCKAIFELVNACSKRKDFSEETYKRDLLLSLYNAILYMIDLGLYYEAERLLERVTGCNGLTNNCV